MRTVFEDEEEETAPARDRHDADENVEQDRELTISATTLLAIFFGLVLICGLFFGLGYTFGRRSPADAQLAAAAAASPSAIQPAAITSKPSAASQPVTPAPADPQTTDTSATADTETPSESTPEKAPETTATPAPPAVKPVVKPALPATMQTAPAITSSTPASALAAIPSSAPTGIAASAGIMVQIAAISNPADANVLVSALQKHGYSVAARHLPGDPLIHVQVGPFPTRPEAIAMRQKLLGDGYNAILK